MEMFSATSKGAIINVILDTFTRCKKPTVIDLLLNLFFHLFMNFIKPVIIFELEHERVYEM